MDLGATVCLARVPRCGVCPLAGACPSRGTRYEPLRKQGRFEGSFRQRRCGRPATRRRAAAFGRSSIGEVVAALLRDGLVERAAGVVRLPINARQAHSGSAIHSCTPLEERDRLRRQPLATTGETELVGRRRTDVDPLTIDAERACEPARASCRGGARSSAPRRSRTQSALTSSNPASVTCRYASASSPSESAPRSARPSDGKATRCRPRPAAPRTASVSACAMTSPSECPASPRGWRCGRRRARVERPPLERVGIDAEPDAEVGSSERR